MKPMLNQGFHYCAQRNLDRDGSLTRVTSGNSMQPLRESSNRFTGRFKSSRCQ
jgi:hypothetical protein